MRFKLPIVGEISINESSVKIIQEPKEKSVGVNGLDLFNSDSSRALSNYKSVSQKLLGANRGWVYINNDVLAQEVGSIQFELFNMKLVGGEIVFDPIVKHPVLELLDKFNEFTSKSDGFYLTASHKNLAGDAFWLMDGKAPKINGLYLLQPDKVEVDLGDPAKGQFIIKSYTFKDTVAGKQVKETYEAEDVVHFKRPNPNNSYRGLSKVEAVAEDIDTDNLINLANRRLYQAGLIGNFVLSTDKSISQEQRKVLRAEVRSSYSGADNAYKTLILSGGLKPTSVQLSNKDMQSLEHLGWLRDKIMAAFGNTKGSLGITDDVNRANAEATILNWKRTTVKKEMQAITETINEFLVPRYGSNLVLGFKDPVPEDRSSKIDEVAKLRAAKIISPNEAREELGFEPVKEDNADNLEPVINEVPASVRNIDLKKALRRSKIYKDFETYKKNLEIAKASRKIAEKHVKSRRKTEPKEVTREHPEFTNEKVWAFHNKQIRIVESIEDVFRNKLLQFIDGLVERALDNVPNELSMAQKKQLINEEEELVRAGLDFRPILMEAGLLAGMSALEFVDSDDTYIGANLRDYVSKNVTKFATSMIQTDKDKIIDLIAEGTASGRSIPEIRRSIREEFEEFSKMQAERVTRTEVIRTSNFATVDAWEQSDVVEGKQWLTAEDDRVDPICADMNGKVVSLNKTYDSTIRSLFEDSSKILSYGSIGEPPIHPNCRCTLLPILVDQKAFDTETYAELQNLRAEVKELEKKVADGDKRTTEIKEAKAELETKLAELQEAD